MYLPKKVSSFLQILTFSDDRLDKWNCEIIVVATSRVLALIYLLIEAFLWIKKVVIA